MFQSTAQVSAIQRLEDFSEHSPLHEDFYRQMAFCNFREQPHIEHLRANGAEPHVISMFVDAFRRRSSESATIPDEVLTPLEEVVRRENLEKDSNLAQIGTKMIQDGEVVYVILNGGKATSMNLDNIPKSELEVLPGLTSNDRIKLHLDFIKHTHGEVRAYHLTSPSTTDDIVKVFSPTWNQSRRQIIQQGLYPRLVSRDDDLLEPLLHSDSSLCFAPPGHGSLLSDLYVSGALDEMIDHGSRYMVVSNADNGGASISPQALAFMKKHNKVFSIEVAARLPEDLKGGHLAIHQDGRFVIREKAQAPLSDQGEIVGNFCDPEVHRYFNTNVITIDLLFARELLQRYNGVLPLPIIQNSKEVEIDGSKIQVVQLETAIGGMIGLVDVPPISCTPITHPDRRSVYGKEIFKRDKRRSTWEDSPWSKGISSSENAWDKRHDGTLMA